jgi:hypothetical protein
MTTSTLIGRGEATVPATLQQVLAIYLIEGI